MQLERIRRVIALQAGLLLAGAGGVQAADSYRTQYTVSILGLTIAKSNFDTKVADGAYDVSGRLSSSGIAKIFDDTDGTVKVNGNVTKSSVVPAAFDLNYKHGKKDKRTSIGFAQGAVVRTENVPPLKKRNDRVPFGPDDLKSVADPLTALMIAAPNAGTVCDRTLRIFDGEMRFDLKMAYSGKQPFSLGAYKGDAVICSAEFVPVSGYPSRRKSIQQLKSSRISVSFASLGDSGIYAPVVAKIGTAIGTVTVQATRFEAIGQGTD
ncbi:MAG: DUF3108 domain-containing protein [Phyllobacterium sp.]